MAISAAFSQLNQGSPFESWSSSLKFDQFNDDHVKVFGSSTFEGWSSSHGFIHFFDEVIFAPVTDNSSVVVEKPDSTKNYEYSSSAIDAQLSADDNGFISSKINIYPNPATDKINISLNLNTNSDIEITLFNSIGNNVFTTLLKDKKQVIKTIDVENMNKGIYFLEIKSESNKTIKKIIIK
jgi:hypothetical protein